MNNTRSQYLILVATTATCIILYAIRIKWTGSFNYGFLLWNLLLAWVPLYFSRLLLRRNNFDSKHYSIVLFLAWLVFFPNAPYIISDFVHLKPKLGIPLWFDILLLMSFAWNGLILGILSLLDIHHVLLKYLSPTASWVSITSILFLSGYGIYLGRFIRLNSWDIVAEPFQVFQKITQNLADPLSLPRIIGVTLGFGLFLLFSYSTIYFIKTNHETTK
jgi:uncharacterized membrane protein